MPTPERMELSVQWRRRITAAVRLARGVTLIELMVALAVLAILLGLGVPYLREFFITNRLAAATNELITGLNLARSEAIRRGVQVTMRRKSSSARNWSEGWEIFVDANSNQLRDSAESVIHTGPASASRVTVNSSAGLDPLVVFDASGRVYDATGMLVALPAAIFVICYDGMLQEGGRTRSRTVIINPAGRVRVGLDSNGDGVPENDAGNNVTSCSPP